MTEVLQLFDPAFEARLQGLPLLSALMVLGLAVGVLTGLFGVGGAFLITPLLRVVFGIPYPLAIGSGLCYMIGSGSSGAARHMRLRNFESRSVVILGLASVVGAFLGATLNRHLNLSLGERGYTLTIHGFFVVVLLATAWLIGRKPKQQRTGRSILQRLPLPPHIDLPRAGLTHISLPGMLLIGLLVGVMNGLMGIGGGVLFMPMLILVVGLTPHQAVGTSLGVVLFSSIAGTISYALHGNVNLCIAMSLLVGSVVGIQFGAWLCHRLRAARLRRWFAVVVLSVVAALLVHSAVKLAR